MHPGARQFHWVRLRPACVAEILFTPKAGEECIELDKSVRLDVLVALEKLKTDPRRYGEPLGNKAGINLFGFYKIRAGRRIRIIYLVKEDDTVVIIAIGRRDRFEAYRTAHERIQGLVDATNEEIYSLEELRRGLGPP